MEVEMSLSRKRRKELKKLRRSAEELRDEQSELLARANVVAREARRQLGLLAQEEVVPRVQTSYQAYLQPGVRAAQGVVGDVGRNVEKGLGTALGSLLAIGDIAKDARVRRAVASLPTSSRKAIDVKSDSGPGVGSVLLIGAGIVAAAGVAYAVWQTFRADDELWVADDEPLPAADDSSRTAL